jgi:hypothetical protein
MYFKYGCQAAGGHRGKQTSAITPDPMDHLQVLIIATSKGYMT